MTAITINIPNHEVSFFFGQLRQMKDGQLQGVNAEEIINL